MSGLGPLVFQLVKSVLAIAAITVELADGGEVVLNIGHQHRVLLHLRVVLYFVVWQCEHQLPGLDLALAPLLFGR